MSHRYTDYTLIHWEKKYTELCNFISENDRLPNRGEKLYAWICNLRGKQRKNQLDADKIEKLDSLHHWIWEPNDSKWEKNYFLFLKLIEVGNLDYFPERENHRLKLWISAQENLKNNESLKKWQLEMLDKISFWEVKNKYILPPVSDWLKNYREIKRYASKNGRLFWVLHPDMEKWVYAQKTDYIEGKLSQDKIVLLENLKQWSWSTTIADDIFEENFSELQKVLKDDGIITRKQRSDHSDIYNWMILQKASYKKGKLPDNMVQKLESLPGWKWGCKGKKRKRENNTDTSSKKTKID